MSKAFWRGFVSILGGSPPEPPNPMFQRFLQGDTLAEALAKDWQKVFADLEQAAEKEKAPALRRRG